MNGHGPGTRYVHRNFEVEAARWQNAVAVQAYPTRLLSNAQALVSFRLSALIEGGGSG